MRRVGEEERREWWIRTDADSGDDLAHAAVEVEEHAQVVLLVRRLLEDVLRRRELVDEARRAREPWGRVRQDDGVGCGQ